MALLDMVWNAVKGLMGGQGAGDMIASQLVERVLQSGVGGGASGLADLISQAGFGEQVQSWLSNGPNLPIAPDQIQQALGPQIGQIASQFGMSPDMISNALSQYLPGIIDKMSPGGRL